MKLLGIMVENATIIFEHYISFSVLELKQTGELFNRQGCMV